MYLFFTASSDATIHEAYPSSNFGQSSLLKVGTIYDSSSQLKRIRSVIDFDLEYIKSIQDVITANPTYSIRLFDCFSKNGNQPYGFSINLMGLSNATKYIEGRGIEEDGWTTGAVSWVQLLNNQDWATTGSDFYSSIAGGTPTCYFTGGNEDFYSGLKFYVDQLGTQGENHGLLLKLADETQYIDTKIFFSKQSSTIFQPRIEVKWDDSVKDDKGRFTYGFNENNNLVYYNFSKGILSDLPNNSVVLNMIPSGTSTILYQTTASRIPTKSGSYIVSSINVTSSFQTGGASIDYYRLNWYSGSSLLLTEWITGSANTIYSSLDNDDLIINCTNLKKYYNKSDYARFDFFIRKKYPTYTFASGNESLGNLIIPNMWYQIEDYIDTSTNNKFMPFDDQCTKLSYDEDGNYFNMYMSSFYPNRTYSIKLKYKINNQILIYPKTFEFIVVD